VISFPPVSPPRPYTPPSPTRSTISQIYFGIELYMFRTYLLSIIRSLNTVFTSVGICHASYVDCLLARSGCSILISLADSQHNLYDIYLLLTDNPMRPCEGKEQTTDHLIFQCKKLHNQRNKWIKQVKKHSRQLAYEE